MYENFMKRANAIEKFVKSNKRVALVDGCLNFEVVGAMVTSDDELVILYKNSDNQVEKIVFDSDEYKINYGLKIDRKYKTIDILRRPTWTDVEDFGKFIR